MYGTQPNNLKDSNIHTNRSAIKNLWLLVSSAGQHECPPLPPRPEQRCLWSVPSAPSRECLDTLQWHSSGLSAWKSPPSPGWLTGVHTLPSIPGVFLNRIFSISEYKHSETEMFLTCHFFRISSRYLKLNMTINLTTVGYTNKSNFKGIVHPKTKTCRKCSYPQAIQDEDEFVSSLEQIWRNVYITCSCTNGSSAVNGCRQNESPNSW